MSEELWTGPGSLHQLTWWKHGSLIAIGRNVKDGINVLCEIQLTECDGQYEANVRYSCMFLLISHFFSPIYSTHLQCSAPRFTSLHPIPLHYFPFLSISLHLTSLLFTLLYSLLFRETSNMVTMNIFTLG